MTTTRSDLYAIADALNLAKPDGKPSAASDQWVRDVRAIATALNDTTGLNTNGNRRFDRDRFLKACGMAVES